MQGVFYILVFSALKNQQVNYKGMCHHMFWPKVSSWILDLAHNVWQPLCSNSRSLAPLIVNSGNSNSGQFYLVGKWP